MFLYRDLSGFFKASRVPNLIILAMAQWLTAVFLFENPVTHDYFFWLLVVTTSMIAGAGYVINDYYDQKIDMINRPKKVVVGIDLKRRPALLGHFLVNILAIAIGFCIDIRIGLIHSFSAFSLWYYSNNLRRLPLIGNLTISFLTSMALVIVAVYYNSFTSEIFVYSIFAFLMILIREIIKDMEALKGDKAFGVITVPVVWGIRGSKVILYVVIALGGMVLIHFLLKEANAFLRLYFIGLTPVFIWFIYQLTKADTLRHYKLLHRFCNYIILSGILSIVLH